MKTYNVKYKGIETYTAQLQEQLTKEFFAKRQFVTGKDILEFTPIPQINFFMLKSLLLAWEQEIEKVKSPFFDFDHPSVQEVLTEFKNTLSHHIKVKEKSFNTLLYNAIYDALELVFNPNEYLCTHFIAGKDVQTVDIETLRGSLKYLKINAFLIESCIQNFEDEGTVQRYKAEKYIDTIYQKSQGNLHDPIAFVDELNKMMPASLDMFLEESYEESHAAEYGMASTDSSTKSFFDDIGNDALPTRNETFKEEETGPTVADALAEQNKRTSFSLNQKIRFRKELFNDEKDVFEEVIRECDRHTDFDTTLDYLMINFAGRYGWDEDSDVFVEFIDVLMKRYE
ncbi:MAG: hypothetical protein GY827_11255 [Cytophagales bacterium]|nr:hypothetical protein [Cytophagales bacterium]